MLRIHVLLQYLVINRITVNGCTWNKSAIQFNSEPKSQQECDNNNTDNNHFFGCGMSDSEDASRFLRMCRLNGRYLRRLDN